MKQSDCDDEMLLSQHFVLGSDGGSESGDPGLMFLKQT
jgi:hypothetical protein